MRANGKEQGEPVGRSLVKRCQESEPTFISATPERSEMPLVD